MMNYNTPCVHSCDFDLSAALEMLAKRVLEKPSIDFIPGHITVPQASNLKPDALILMLLANMPVASPAPIRRPAKEVLQGQDNICLNGTWKFQIDPAADAQTNSKGVILPYQSVESNRVTPGETAGYAKADFNDSGWDEVQVPGSWNTLDRYANYFGNGWYRTEFNVAHEPDQRVRISFDAVYYQAEVWLNGERIGEHIGGYLPFEFDVTEHIDSKAPNTLAVRVSNRFKQGAWWPWGGIIRDVRVLIDPSVRIDRQRIVAIPDLASGQASVNVTAVLYNASKEAQTVGLHGKLTDKQGKMIAALSGEHLVTVPANSERDVVLSAELEDDVYQLWHFDAPHLYFSELSLSGLYPYQRADRFGIRKVDLDNDTFRLNGEAVRLLGFNRVSDDRVNGNMEPTYVVRRDLDRMKAVGTNLARIHHVQQAPELIAYADEIGILLIGEVPVFGEADISQGNRQPEHELKEMIKRDFNHPSVFAWSVANEIPSTSNESRTFVSSMIAVAKELDPNRPATYARKSAGGVSKNDSLKFTDFACVNLYSGFADGTAAIHKLWPNKPVFVSEFSADGYTFSTRRETLEHTSTVSEVVRQWSRNPYVLGASVWSYNDYRSQFSGTSINQARGWGIQDTWGNLKAGYAEVQRGFAPVKKVSLAYEGVVDGKNQSLLVLEPRDIAARSIPSFTLRGYQLVWQALGADERVLAGYQFELDDVVPGSELLVWKMAWPQPRQTVYCQRLSLLSPTGYEVAVAESALRAPSMPKITQMIAAQNGIRVVFKPAVGADIHALRVSDGQFSQLVTVTGSTQITVENLSGDEPFSVELMASNALGATITPVQSILLGSGSMPPYIQGITAVENGFALGFIRPAKEIDAWDVEVRDPASGKMVHRYTTEVIGATRYQGLQGNKSYAVRIRNSGSGAWSQWIEVHTLAASDTKTQLTVLGTSSGEHSIVVKIVPHPQAERYHASVISDGHKENRTFEMAAVDLLMFQDLKPSSSYTIALRVETAHGISNPVLICGHTQAPDYFSYRPVVIELDTDSPEYSEHGGEWHDSVDAGRYSRSKEPGARWTPTILEDGHYRVEYKIFSTTDATDDASYAVDHADGVTEVAINQTQRDGYWVVLGSWNFAKGEQGRVTVSAPTGILRTHQLRYTRLGPMQQPVVGTLFDTTDPNSYSELSGAWENSTQKGRFSRSARASAEWQITPSQSGDYRLSAYVERTDQSTDAALYKITQGPIEDQVRVDQLQTSGNWVYLGQWPFAAGKPVKVQVENLGKALLRTHMIELFKVSD